MIKQIAYARIECVAFHTVQSKTIETIILKMSQELYLTDTFFGYVSLHVHQIIKSN